MRVLLNVFVWCAIVVAIVMYLGSAVMVFFEPWPWYKKLGWLLVILFVPILGPMYYLDARSEKPKVE